MGSQRSGWALCLALVAAGCSQTVGTPPQGLVLTQLSYDGFSLQWSSVPGVDGYVVEGRAGPAEWVTFGPALVKSSNLTVQLGADTAENSDVEFRVSSLQGKTRSAPSSVVHQHRGLRPPDSVRAGPGPNAAIEVGWSRVVGLADRALVERTAGSGPDAGWTQLADVDRVLGGWEDPTPPSDALLRYRVRFALATEESDAVEAASPTSVLLAPDPVVLTPGVGSVALRWTNHAPAALEIIIRRAPGIAPDPFGNGTVELAHLAPDTQAYDDHPGDGAFVYSIEAWSSFTSSSTPWIAAITQPALGSGSLRTSIFLLPSGTVRALDPDGGWWIFSPDVYSNTAQVWRPAGNGWIPRTLSGGFTRFSPPTLQLDDAGRAHLVWLTTDVAGGDALVAMHAWFDGSQWTDEELFRETVDYGPDARLGFVVRPDGTLDLIWSPASAGRVPEYLYRASGSWVREPITALAPGVKPVLLQPVVDSAGTVHTALGMGGQVLGVTRLDAGVWSAETVPTGDVNANIYDSLGTVTTAGGAWAIFYERSFTFGQVELRMVMKTPQGWAPSELVGFRPWGTSKGWALAAGRTLERIAVGYPAEVGTQLFVWTDGEWQSAYLLSAADDTPTLHFGAGDRLSALTRIGYGGLTDGGWAGAPHALYEE